MNRRVVFLGVALLAGHASSRACAPHSGSHETDVPIPVDVGTNPKSAPVPSVSDGVSLSGLAPAPTDLAVDSEAISASGATESGTVPDPTGANEETGPLPAPTSATAGSGPVPSGIELTPAPAATDVNDETGSAPAPTSAGSETGVESAPAETDNGGGIFDIPWFSWIPGFGDEENAPQQTGAPSSSERSRRGIPDGAILPDTFGGGVAEELHLSGNNYKVTRARDAANNRFKRGIDLETRSEEAEDTIQMDTSPTGPEQPDDFWSPIPGLEGLIDFLKGLFGFGDDGSGDDQSAPPAARRRDVGSVGANALREEDGLELPTMSDLSEAADAMAEAASEKGQEAMESLKDLADAFVDKLKDMMGGSRKRDEPPAEARRAVFKKPLEEIYLDRSRGRNQGAGRLKRGLLEQQLQRDHDPIGDVADAVWDGIGELAAKLNGVVDGVSDGLGYGPSSGEQDKGNQRKRSQETNPDVGAEARCGVFKKVHMGGIPDAAGYSEPNDMQHDGRGCSEFENTEQDFLGLLTHYTPGPVTQASEVVQRVVDCAKNGRRSTRDRVGIFMECVEGGAGIHPRQDIPFGDDIVCTAGNVLGCHGHGDGDGDHGDHGGDGTNPPNRGGDAPPTNKQMIRLEEILSHLGGTPSAPGRLVPRQRNFLFDLVCIVFEVVAGCNFGDGNGEPSLPRPTAENSNPLNSQPTLALNRRYASSIRRQEEGEASMADLANEALNVYNCFDSGFGRDAGSKCDIEELKETIQRLLDGVGIGDSGVGGNGGEEKMRLAVEAAMQSRRGGTLTTAINEFLDSSRGCVEGLVDQGSAGCPGVSQDCEVMTWVGSLRNVIVELGKAVQADGSKQNVRRRALHTDELPGGFDAEPSNTGDAFGSVGPEAPTLSAVPWPSEPEPTEIPGSGRGGGEGDEEGGEDDEDPPDHDDPCADDDAWDEDDDDSWEEEEGDEDEDNGHGDDVPGGEFTDSSRQSEDATPTAQFSDSPWWTIESDIPQFTEIPAASDLREPSRFSDFTDMPQMTESPMPSFTASSVLSPSSDLGEPASEPWSDIFGFTIVAPPAPSDVESELPGFSDVPGASEAPTIPSFSDLPEFSNIPAASDLPNLSDVVPSNVPSIPSFSDLPESSNIPGVSDLLPDASEILPSNAPTIPSFSDLPEFSNIPGASELPNLSNVIPSEAPTIPSFSDIPVPSDIAKLSDLLPTEIPSMPSFSDLPGVSKLPDVSDMVPTEIPTIPSLSELPGFSDLPNLSDLIPSEIPSIPSFSDLPGLSDLPNLSDLIPSEIPSIPSFSDLPGASELPNLSHIAPTELPSIPAISGIPGASELPNISDLQPSDMPSMPSELPGISDLPNGASELIPTDVPTVPSFSDLLEFSNVPAASDLPEPSEVMPSNAFTVPSFSDLPEFSNIPGVSELPGATDLPSVQSFTQIPAPSDLPQLTEIPNVPSFSGLPGATAEPDIPQFSDIPIPSAPDIPGGTAIPNFTPAPGLPDPPDLPGVTHLPGFSDLPEPPGLSSEVEVSSGMILEPTDIPQAPAPAPAPTGEPGDLTSGVSKSLVSGSSSATDLKDSGAEATDDLASNSGGVVDETGASEVAWKSESTLFAASDSGGTPEVPGETGVGESGVLVTDTAASDIFVTPTGAPGAPSTGSGAATDVLETGAGDSANLPTGLASASGAAEETGVEEESGASEETGADASSALEETSADDSGAPEESGTADNDGDDGWWPWGGDESGAVSEAAEATSTPLAITGFAATTGGPGVSAPGGPELTSAPVGSASGAAEESGAAEDSNDGDDANDDGGWWPAGGDESSAAPEAPEPTSEPVKASTTARESGASQVGGATGVSEISVTGTAASGVSEESGASGVGVGATETASGVASETASGVLDLTSATGVSEETATSQMAEITSVPLGFSATVSGEESGAEVTSAPLELSASGVSETAASGTQVTSAPLEFSATDISAATVASEAEVTSAPLELSASDVSQETAASEAELTSAPLEVSASVSGEGTRASEAEATNVSDVVGPTGTAASEVATLSDVSGIFDFTSASGISGKTSASDIIGSETTTEVLGLTSAAETEISGVLEATESASGVLSNGGLDTGASGVLEATETAASEAGLISATGASETGWSETGAPTSGFLNMTGVVVLETGATDVLASETGTPATGSGILDITGAPEATASATEESNWSTAMVSILPISLPNSDEEMTVEPMVQQMSAFPQVSHDPSFATRDSGETHSVQRRGVEEVSKARDAAGRQSLLGDFEGLKCDCGHTYCARNIPDKFGTPEVPSSPVRAYFPYMYQGLIIV